MSDLPTPDDWRYALSTDEPPNPDDVADRLEAAVRGLASGNLAIVRTEDIRAVLYPGEGDALGKHARWVAAKGRLAAVVGGVA
jgi:hypothetical protein